jgi:DNA-directed RNA polymerase specialized sigma24 family protein
MLRAFEKIPQHYREVVLLADVQEFSYKEIANTLGIPVGTVMSRLNRGRKLLRGELTVLPRTEPRDEPVARRRFQHSHLRTR